MITLVLKGLGKKYLTEKKNPMHNKFTNFLFDLDSLLHCFSGAGNRCYSPMSQSPVFKTLNIHPKSCFLYA